MTSTWGKMKKAGLDLSSVIQTANVNSILILSIILINFPENNRLSVVNERKKEKEAAIMKRQPPGLAENTELIDR